METDIFPYKTDFSISIIDTSLIQLNAIKWSDFVVWWVVYEQSISRGKWHHTVASTRGWSIRFNVWYDPGAASAEPAGAWRGRVYLDLFIFTSNFIF